MTQAATPPLLQVRDLRTHFFTDLGVVPAVDGIDLEVAPGEIYGFLGPNGAGKSTTVLVLTTLLPPTAGTARVGGLDVVRQGAEVRRTGRALLRRTRRAVLRRTRRASL